MANNKKKTRLGVFGLGNMGQAIFKLLSREQTGQRPSFFICSTGLKKIKGAVVLDSLDRLIKQSDIVFLCIKPQDFYNLKPVAPNDKIFISIMAGVKIKNIKKIVNSQKIVRVMPNLPLRVGRGVIAWFADEKRFSKNQLDLIKKLFTAFGHSFKVNIEDDLDKITALTGSGPAYVFLFIDALIKSAVSLGFSKKTAEVMVWHLLDGSLKYFKSVKNIYRPEELVQMVKSKKGTTEAALNKLNIVKFNQQWQAAVKAAYGRAKEISDYEIK